MSALPTFLGLDLAWSSRNLSGGALIREGRLLDARGDLSDDASILTWIGEHLPDAGPAILAVDAPLRVPNQTGARPCDRELSAEWRRHEAGALPANRRLLARDGVVRGELLVQQLVRHYGFREQIPIPRRSAQRIVCEVYPHPAHVSLFGLTTTLKYKARRRAYEERWQAFARYRNYLVALEHGDPPVLGIRAALQRFEIPTLRGRALKRFEDMLDAITCAYVAAYFWHHGPARTRIYGTLAAGHILVPLAPTTTGTSPFPPGPW